MTSHPGDVADVMVELQMDRIKPDKPLRVLPSLQAAACMNMVGVSAL